MEPARRARVRKREEAEADVIHKTLRLVRRIKAAGDPAAEADRVAERAADKAAESDLNLKRSKS